jgi:ketosteroid isomerase-like protein
VIVRLVLVAIALGGCASPRDATFADLIRARNDAIARGDSATVHRGMTDDMEWVIGATGAQLQGAHFLAAISHVQNPPPEFTIDSLHVRDLGDVATVTYRRMDTRRLGNVESSNWTRALEVYVRRDGHWLLAQHSHTWIVKSPPTVAMDSAALAAFVGHYQIGDGVFDNVHFEKGHLVATLSGLTEGAVLMPVTASAFSPDGIAPLIVFERDASGRVIDYVQDLPDGMVTRATYTGGSDTPPRALPRPHTPTARPAAKTAP